jgi:hypothetical protein
MSIEIIRRSLTNKVPPEPSRLHNIQDSTTVWIQEVVNISQVVRSYTFAKGGGNASLRVEFSSQITNALILRWALA